MTIRKRFIIFSIILGIVPVIISTSICIANFNAKNIELIKQNIITEANDQSMHLEAFFDQNVSDLNITANIPLVKDLLFDSNNKVNIENQKNNRKILNELFSDRINQQFYLSIGLLINNDGIIIASSDDEYINTEIMISSKEIERLKNNELVITNIIEREDFNGGIKSAIIAKPIFLGNQYQGAVINIINMNYFKNILNNIHFFQSGKISVMDSNGKIAVSNSENLKDSINRINTSNNLYEQWIKIDFHSNPNGLIQYEINGKEKIGYYSTINNTGWIVLSGVEWAEFKNPMYKNISNIITFTIFIFIIVIVSYMFIINYFTKPIYKLLEVIRKIKQGYTKDRFIYDKNNEFGEIATAFNDLIDNIEKNKKHIQEKNRDLQSITSNIPGGVYRCRIENGDHILEFVNGGYLNILGYEKHGFKDVFGKKLIELIYEQDKERVIREIREQLCKSNKYNVEYRVKQKDESVIWLLDKGQIMKNKYGKEISYSVVINITESKIIQEELRLSEERYRIVMSQTEDIIFEWNIKDDSIYFSENWKNKFNYESTIVDISKKIYQSNIIYKDDIKKLGKILNDIINGERYKEIEIRLRKNDGEFIWCKIRATAMFDQENNIFRVIGSIIDIHKEKMEADKLLFKAQRDSLTGLYNKGTVESVIEEYLENEGLNSKGALFMIDVDYFKDINDNLGHLVGDYVLSNISSMLSEVFNENSIIGRIGGDEFIVFLKNIDSQEFLYKKADDLVKGFKTDFVEETKDYKVSGSIGISRFPEHGKSFRELFVNADEAVYLAKNKGRDNYCVFGES
ncbi:sensor domain-containing diguanylate cyclase [Clostridium beijerinckii]|nr:sensor domain-containing diguanylate cyclase [Clostridium beijerinckii]